MTKENKETQTNLNQQVSIWVVRHFRPDPKYSEETPLTETAPQEARETSKVILSHVEDGEALVIYGADKKGRHQATRRLLESELEKQIREGNREIELIKLPSTSYKRRSLRGPGFNREYVRERAGGVQNLLSYWMTERDSFEGQVQMPEAVKKRLRILINGLFQYTRRCCPGPRVHWVLVTSGEIAATEIVRGFGDASLALEPGRWIRFDLDQGKSLDSVGMTHWGGRSVTIDFSRT